MESVVDVEPRLRRFLELRERTFVTHWTQRRELKRKPTLEFDREWRATCDREWRNACKAFEDYCFWTYTVAVDTRPLCWQCLEPMPADRLQRGGTPAKYCGDRCKGAAWKARHPAARTAIERRYREKRKRRQLAA